MTASGRIPEETLIKNWGFAPGEEAEVRREIAALLASGETETSGRSNGLNVRAINALTPYRATTVEKIRKLGRVQLLRGPNCGLKTVNRIADAVFGGHTQEHWTGRPEPVKRPTTIVQRLNAAKRANQRLYQENAVLQARLREVERHLSTARDYNERMRLSVIEIVAAYHRLNPREVNR